MNDKMLLKTVSGFRDGILAGGSSSFMCFAVCAPLQGYLSALGVETRLVQGLVDCGEYDMDHAWLELSDRRILDPTADQFPALKGCDPLPPVYIGPMPEWYERYDWQGRST